MQANKSKNIEVVNLGHVDRKYQWRRDNKICTQTKQSYAISVGQQR